MGLHRAFRARRVRRTGIGGEVRHGVTSGVSCETSKNMKCNTSPPQGVQAARAANPGRQPSQPARDRPVAAAHERVLQTRDDLLLTVRTGRE